jgi:hypothetical protein
MPRALQDDRENELHEQNLYANKEEKRLQPQEKDNLKSSLENNLPKKHLLNLKIIIKSLKGYFATVSNFKFTVINTLALVTNCPTFSHDQEDAPGDVQS